jgi:hypothetical protein
VAKQKFLQEIPVVKKTRLIKDCATGDWSARRSGGEPQAGDRAAPEPSRPLICCAVGVAVSRCPPRRKSPPARVPDPGYRESREMRGNHQCQ